METISIIMGELEYLEVLVKLAKRHKDEEVQQVTHVCCISFSTSYNQASLCQ